MFYSLNENNIPIQPSFQLAGYLALSRPSRIPNRRSPMSHDRLHAIAGICTKLAAGLLFVLGSIFGV